MHCPKCGAAQPDGTTICRQCGIVFEKYWKYHLRPGEAAPPVARPDLEVTADSSRPPWRELVLPPTTDADPLTAWARAVLLGILIIWGLPLIGSSVDSNAVGQSFLHLINLPFHEAGHVLFRPFGAFITSLGGTLGQLLMPLICLLVLLLKTHDPFGAAVALWWFGENFLDIAPYINDARAGVLPLLGGNFGHSSPYGFHDWEFILTESGLLHLDQQIAQFSHMTGAFMMLAAMVWGGLLVHRQMHAAKDAR
ncbi:hypothetical protein Thiowin_03876 [Thiorhodovibrio winogradskyi]|uniref:Zinc ribbon domain-containing protein n=1 Tax=Thiorhodovibrio winogradskyi TaxID=77007 RepID=A0ABZ0SCN9_9GAMM|nr:zinc ribbon domain-containing protein [Thiorhodovibrio winogradskyi]